MSNDLISKSALLEEMRKFVGNQRYLILEEVLGMVENFPIAYDVDKVVNRIKGKHRKDLGAPNAIWYNFGLSDSVDEIEAELRL